MDTSQSTPTNSSAPQTQAPIQARPPPPPITSRLHRSPGAR
jgi:hypothetical protein